ncbi:MAG: hypothetical protein GXP08_06260 [Gammaproteobacteria bacterium]|nr:hypothetical protein [Gammaproteobacteria bacterium]
MKYFGCLITSLLVVFSAIATASDQRSVMAEIVLSVSNVCHSPNNKSKYWLLDIKGEGEAKLKLKLANAGLSGEAKFTKEEWEGVQRVLREHQITDNKTYRDCVTLLTPLFLDRFVLTSSSTKGASSPVRSSKKSRATNLSTTWNGLDFKIREAKMEGSDLYIKFKIFSPGKDRVIKMMNGGNAFVMIDGDQYQHSHFQIGKSSGYSLFSGVTIPGDLSVNSIVKFKSVPNSLEKVDMLRLLFWNEKVSFRDISVN